MLKVISLYAGYVKGNPIIKGIDLEMGKSDIVGILGHNGSGKSTFAKAICGLVPYLEGSIVLEGKPISGLPTYRITKSGISLFLQGGRVFGNLTVAENLILACAEWDHKERDARIRWVSQWFELVRNPNRTKLKASFLSGGEKHLLGLALVLLQKPNFLILDEPSSGLSPENQAILYDIIKKYSNSQGIPVLLIEQNINLVKALTDKILSLSNGVFK
jgi:branched-chain amino acid transport system ATP-binding protein